MMMSFSEGATKADMDGTKCDVFSFAILAVFVVTGENPYAGLKNEEIFIKVGIEGKRMVIPAGYTGTGGEKVENHYGQFIELVKQMWDQQPEARPDFRIIVEKL